jgi:hypothetical protein
MVATTALVFRHSWGSPCFDLVLALPSPARSSRATSSRLSQSHRGRPWTRRRGGNTPARMPALSSRTRRLRRESAKSSYAFGTECRCAVMTASSVRKIIAQGGDLAALAIPSPDNLVHHLRHVAIAALRRHDRPADFGRAEEEGVIMMAAGTARGEAEAPIGSPSLAEQ